MLRNSVDIDGLAFYNLENTFVVRARTQKPPKRIIVVLVSITFSILGNSSVHSNVELSRSLPTFLRFFFLGISDTREAFPIEFIIETY